MNNKEDKNYQAQVVEGIFMCRNYHKIQKKMYFGFNENNGERK